MADHVPQARVVREAGRPARPVPVPFSRRARVVLGPMGSGAKAAINAAFGMWPLTAVILMGALLLILAGQGSGR